MIELLKSYFKLHDRDDHSAIREKVTVNLLDLNGSLKTYIPALLALLDTPSGDSEWEKLDPQLRRKTHDAVKRLPADKPGSALAGRVRGFALIDPRPSNSTTSSVAAGPHVAARELSARVPAQVAVQVLLYPGRIGPLEPDGARTLTPRWGTICRFCR